MSEEIAEVIQRVRRATRNSSILAICDEVEKLQRELQAATSDKVKKLEREVKKLQAEVKALQPKTADKQAYQREYMRRYRAGETGKRAKKARR